MAEGIVDDRVPEDETIVYDVIKTTAENGETEATVTETDLFPDVKIMVAKTENCYKVEVTDNNDLVTVTTYIRGGGTQ